MAQNGGQRHKALHELVGEQIHGDEHGQSALHDVAEQGEQAAGPAAEAGHIGRADIAAAGFAGVDALEGLGNDEAEGNGAEQEGKGHAKEEIEAGHGKETFLC